MKQTVLVTGGTGFLGRRLGKAMRDGFRVVLAGRNHDQNRAAEEFSGCAARGLDVTNIESVRDALVEIRPDIVIHAAASKYVDIAERLPLECIDCNVLGSENVARAAVERGVRTVIGVSTDKAAPPISNTYGLTKALMERLFCAMNGRGDTRFMCVRFGNMPWSTGSFLTAWKRMHDSTGVIGTTGPEMTRLFTPVNEAVQLIVTSIVEIEAFQGRVLAREMKAALIGDILKLWTASKGGEWRRIEGRPGERRHEYLIGETERPHTTALEVDGVRHYVLSFNQLAETALPAAVSSAEAPRFSDRELLDIIDNPPPELP